MGSVHPPVPNFVGHNPCCVNANKQKGHVTSAGCKMLVVTWEKRTRKIPSWTLAWDDGRKRTLKIQASKWRSEAGECTAAMRCSLCIER